MFKSLTDFDALSNTWPIESDFLAKRPSLSTRVSIELSRELPWILPCRTSHFRTWSDGTPHKYCRCARSLSHWQACKRCTYCCLRFLSLTLSSASVRVCHGVLPSLPFAHSLIGKSASVPRGVASDSFLPSHNWTQRALLHRSSSQIPLVRRSRSQTCSLATCFSAVDNRTWCFLWHRPTLHRKILLLQTIQCEWMCCCTLSTAYGFIHTPKLPPWSPASLACTCSHAEAPPT
jgi:hypothetical protein